MYDQYKHNNWHFNFITIHFYDYPQWLALCFLSEFFSNCWVPHPSCEMAKICMTDNMRFNRSTEDASFLPGVFSLWLHDDFAFAEKVGWLRMGVEGLSQVQLWLYWANGPGVAASPCKNEINRWRSAIWVCSWSTTCSLISSGFWTF